MDLMDPAPLLHPDLSRWNRGQSVFLLVDSLHRSLSPGVRVLSHLYFEPLRPFASPEYAPVTWPHSLLPFSFTFLGKSLIPIRLLTRGQCHLHLSLLDQKRERLKVEI